MFSWMKIDFQKILSAFMGVWGDQKCWSIKKLITIDRKIKILMVKIN